MSTTYKKLTERLDTLMEDNSSLRVGPTRSHAAADDIGYQAHDMVNDGTVARLNVWLNGMSKRPHLNPLVAIVNMKTYLQVTGLDFEMPKFEEDGVYKVRMTQWGGPYREVEGILIRTDGISDKIAGGLFMKFTYRNSENGVWLTAKIVGAEQE